ncbi:MAG: hypothetical protein JRF02_06140, partial [Deltaproteobacteria bacterium]|nr:hypothetical protein [Deltaproteobacteria bacterium]
MRGHLLIFCLIVLLCGGCTHTEVWQKTGGSQQSFDLDSRECGSIARQVSLLQSETGKKAEPTFFSRSYNECLAAKGWRRKATAPEPRQTPDLTGQTLAELVNPYTVEGFGQTI